MSKHKYERYTVIVLGNLVASYPNKDEAIAHGKDIAAANETAMVEVFDTKSRNGKYFDKNDLKPVCLLRNW